MIHYKLNIIIIVVISVFLYLYNQQRFVVIDNPTDYTLINKLNIIYGQVIVKNETTTINLPVIYYPKTELRLDTQKITYRIDPDTKQIQFDVPTGTHNYYLRIINTTFHKIINAISLIFLFAFIIKLIRESK